MSLLPLRVAISTTARHGGLAKLCPDASLIWQGCELLLNPPRGTSCDFWIIWPGSRERDWMHVAPQNTLFIAGEPPSKKIYPAKFYKQFHHVVSTHAADPHPRVTVSMLGLNWHAGLDHQRNRYTIGYNELATLPQPIKSNGISVVCSNLTTTEGQRKRLAFLERLKSALGPTVIHYGRGFTPIPDKLQAILPQRFHLVLENSSSPHYWSEKLSDAYLGWAFPIYVGCPNLADYFPENGFLAIHPDQPELAIDLIRHRLELAHSPEEMEAVSHCRDLILHDYNPFSRFAHWAKTFHQPGLSPRICRATSHKAFRAFPKNWLHSLTSLVKPRD